MEGDRLRFEVVPDLEDPLHMVFLGAGELLLAELSGQPGQRTYLTQFSITGTGLAVSGHWLSRRFDGGALVLDESARPWATTKRGLRRVYPVQDDLKTEGRLETYALDSEVYGVQWHRVFLDVCLPPGCRVEVAARSADEFYPPQLQPDPRPPEGYTTRWSEADRPVLGSRSPADDEGWVPLGALDVRAPQIDVPLCTRGELPSDDPYPRDASKRAGLRFVTLEGLLRVPPGRYLWLRVTFRGTRRRSPTLLSLRATLPRPSLLSYLPSFWQRDSASARLMDEFLSLFEGELTTRDQRIDVLRHLIDPRITPPEALDWLASFVALRLDNRLSEGVRRQLVQEAMTLYRQRGTLPGLERLCAILTGCEVKIIEGFRLRPSTDTALGTREGERGLGSILGPTLSLISAEEEGLEDWEQELLDSWRELRAHLAELRVAYEEARERGELAVDERLGKCCEEESEVPRPPCPPRDPKEPLNLDPLITLYRHYAHRFSVILFTSKCAELEEIVDQAVEAWKPTHTLHELCWLDPGLRVGVNSYVGFGTRLADGERPQPVVLGAASPTGPGTILGRSTPSGPRVGESRVGRTTELN